MHFEIDIIFEWSLTDKNELRFTLDDSNSEGD